MAADRERVLRADKPSIETLLDRELTAFDQLMAEVRVGIRNATHYDQLEERARSISRGLTDAFRKGRA